MRHLSETTRKTTLKTALLTVGVVWGTVASAQAPSTDVLLTPLPEVSGEAAVVAQEDVTYLTDNDRYDNQPSFTPDGAALLFVAADDTGQTDIYRYDLAAAETVQVTRTQASEFSPQVTPDGEAVTAVRIEADGETQRLWRFGLGGANPEANPADVYRVGYYTFVDAETLAFIIVAETESGEQLSLQTVDTASGEATVITEPVGVGVQKVPGEAAVSFVQRNEDGSSSLSVYDLTSAETRVLTETLPEVDAHTFLPDGSVIAAQDSVVYRWAEGQDGWQPYLDFSETDVADIGRLTVSPDGSQLAFVITKATE